MNDPRSHSGKSTGAFTIVVGAYVMGLAVAIATGAVVAELHPLFVIGVADLAGTAVVFAFSVATRNSSMYDPYWSVAPPVIAGYLWWLFAPGDATHPRQLLVGVLVLVWSVRLTWNWWRQWGGLGHEDWRYMDLRGSSGRAYWLVSLLGIHLFPTILVYLGCFSLYAVFVPGDRPLGILDVAAAMVTAGGIWIEAAADRQLHRFRSSRPPDEAILETGIWAYSRHPNYFGEITFWWGLALFGLAAFPESRWILAGPLAMTALFLFISIPMKERRMLIRRPGYARRIRQVSMLVPWPRRRAHGHDHSA